VHCLRTIPGTATQTAQPPLQHLVHRSGCRSSQSNHGRIISQPLASTTRRLPFLRLEARQVRGYNDDRRVFSLGSNDPGAILRIGPAIPALVLPAVSLRGDSVQIREVEASGLVSPPVVVGAVEGFRDWEDDVLCGWAAALPHFFAEADLAVSLSSNVIETHVRSRAGHRDTIHDGRVRSGRACWTREYSFAVLRTEISRNGIYWPIIERRQTGVVQSTRLRSVGTA
jgi:hypothetical protein